MHETWASVDVIGVCLPADQRIGPGDSYLISQIAELTRRPPKLVALATKTDLVSPDRLRQHLLSIQEHGAKLGIEWEHIVPVSAVSGGSRSTRSPTCWCPCCRRGRGTTPRGRDHRRATETLVAELIREAALEGVREELPHSIVVTIEEMGLREGRAEDKPLLDIYASLIVERDSQKGIMIGHKGSRLREVGTTARLQIAALLGTPVHLDLRVKVFKEWQRDAKYLNRLGF